MSLTWYYAWLVIFVTLYVIGGMVSGKLNRIIELLESMQGKERGR